MLTSSLLVFSGWNHPSFAEDDFTPLSNEEISQSVDTPAPAAAAVDVLAEPASEQAPLVAEVPATVEPTIAEETAVVEPPAVTQEAVTQEVVAPDVVATENATPENAPPEVVAPDIVTPEIEKPAVVAIVPVDATMVSAALEDVLASTEAISKKSRKLLSSFYAEREFAPLWIEDGKLSGPARAVIHRFNRADTYGLNPARYPTPSLEVGIDAGTTPPDLLAADLVTAEVTLTLAALRFAADAQAGTFDPNALGKFMGARPVPPKPRAVLDGLADTPDMVAYLEGFNPQHPAFKKLQALLAELRARTSSDALPEIPQGRTLKPGMSDPRVPLLRTRLGLPAIGAPSPIEGTSETPDETVVVTASISSDIRPNANELLYDKATVDALKAFQENASLEVDGAIGPQTLAALNGGAKVTEADILVNMERWRWMPRDMGSFNVWVNIPEYRLRVISGDAAPFETRVIVGTSKNQTPIFSDKIEYVDVNPYWNVPRSIAVKEMMPEIRQDPNFFARRGLEVIYTGGGREMLIDPRSVDWGLWDPETMPFRFRQPPGGGNALGRVKFMFPNKHAVYLHDTPTRNLFAKSVRSFSHGCVRVDKPVAFADALLAREEHLNGKRIKQSINGGENGTLPLKRHVPVHLTYFTVWVDAAGETQKRADLYGYDKNMKVAMRLGS